MSDYLSRLVMRSLNRTEVIKPRLASFFEPSVQGEPVFGTESGSERLDASSTSDETVHDNLQSVWLSDQTPQLKLAALQPAWSGSQQTPGQPRLGTTQQASSSSSSSSSVPPEVTAHSSGKTSQQKASQDLPAPSDGDETYVVSPGAAAERNRSSAHEPAIQPITIESPPTSPEVTAQPPAGRMVQQESDHEMLTPLSSGDGETYHLPPRVTAERNRESTREPAIQPIPIEQIVPHVETQPRASEPAEPAVIRVTIGRIEVRATTPPLPAAPRTRVPGPALTLDDYLKQRNGGQL